MKHFRIDVYISSSRLNSVDSAAAMRFASQSFGASSRAVRTGSVHAVEPALEIKSRGKCRVGAQLLGVERDRLLAKVNRGIQPGISPVKPLDSVDVSLSQTDVTRAQTSDRVPTTA